MKMLRKTLALTVLLTTLLPMFVVHPVCDASWAEIIIRKENKHGQGGEIILRPEKKGRGKIEINTRL